MSTPHNTSITQRQYLELRHEIDRLRSRVKALEARLKTGSESRLETGSRRSSGRLKGLRSSSSALQNDPTTVIGTSLQEQELGKAYPSQSLRADAGEVVESSQMEEIELRRPRTPSDTENLEPEASLLPMAPMNPLVLELKPSDGDGCSQCRAFSSLFDSGIGGQLAEDFTPSQFSLSSWIWQSDSEEDPLEPVPSLHPSKAIYGPPENPAAPQSNFEWQTQELMGPASPLPPSRMDLHRLRHDNTE